MEKEGGGRGILFWRIPEVYVAWPSLSHSVYTKDAWFYSNYKNTLLGGLLVAILAVL